LARKKKTRSEIVSEITDIIVGHLETLAPDEREARVAAFRETMAGKRARVRAKAE